ncbi:MAG: zf-HC2 domain-containing protein [Nitrospirae bacterium]|nr:zf-HC2 domain-containing protein [Nitrospirota bacterium]
MKCRIVQKKLSAYQDRELELQEQEQVTSHLLSCRTCHERHAALEQVWQTLAELEEIHPDPWFYRQLVIKIKEPCEQGLLPNFQRVFRLMPSPVIASILLVIGILAGTYLGSILTRHDLLPSQNDPLINSQGTFFSSLKAFDPVPPGTLAHGYLQMANYEERESR